MNLFLQARNLDAVLARSAHDRVISHSSPSDEKARSEEKLEKFPAESSETYVSEGEQNKLPRQTLSAIMRC